jgi:hypothetical protein
MRLKLPDSVCSRQDLAALLLEVKDYARWFSHATIKKQVDAGYKPTPTAVSPAAAELIHAWGAKKSLSTTSLDELIALLKDCTDHAPSITITLAAPAPGDVKSRIVAWCRNNIRPDILVTFQFNATLLGGMVVRFGSHIADWSFRREILAARERFPEVLRHV